jgi:hypothetical protein
MGRDEHPILLPASISHHFSNLHNLSSPILHRFYRFLPQLAARATPDGVHDPINHFVLRTSTKSARDHIRQEASLRRYHTLRATASPDLLRHLSEILIASSSYPLISMSRSNKSHRLPSDLFSISLKRKLHLDIYPSSNLPVCICGSTIDPKGSHVFNCKKVSKWGCHNRIRDGLVPILTTVLKTAQVIHPSSTLFTEPSGIIPHIPNCRPFDISFRPDSNPAVYDRAPCPFSEIGFDVTITPSKSHLPPSCSSDVPSNSANAADQHLNKKEKVKLQRAGMVDSLSNYVSGSDIIGSLLDTNMVLIPLAISPLGKWGGMFHTFLFGPSTKHSASLTFQSNTSNAARMYHRATSSPNPTGIIPLATNQWNRSKTEHQSFYGHSHTAPTPKEYTLQKCGLVITTALAIHLRDAKRGTLHAAPSSSPVPPPPGFHAQSLPHQQPHHQPFEQPESRDPLHSFRTRSSIGNQSPAPADFVLDRHCNNIGSL